MEAGELEEARKETELRVLEKNKPLRDSLIAELKSFVAEPKPDFSLEDTDAKWQELGVVLDEEKGLAEEFEVLLQKSKVLLKKVKDEVVEKNDKRQEIFNRLEALSKQEAVSDKEDFEECLRMWLHMENESPANEEELKRFKRLTERIQVLLKRGDHHIKVEKLENLCRDLTALKHNVELKVPEKNREIKRIKDQFKELDLHTGNKVQKLREKFSSLLSQVQQELGWERWSNSKRKEDLVAKAEELLTSETLESLGDSLKSLQKEWKEIGFTSKADDEQWEKFKSVCDQVYQKFQTYLQANEAQKNELLEKAEELKESDTWRKSTGAYKELQEKWKKVGPVPLKAQWKLERQFRKVCNHFFERRRGHLEVVEGQQKENLKKKEMLLANAEKIAKEPNWKSIFSKLRELQVEWKAIGPVPKEQSDEIWNKFKAACDIVYDKKKAEDNVNLAEETKHMEEKEALLVKMKEALGQTDLVQIKNELTSLEKQWREIGDVPRNKKRSIEMKLRDVWASLDKKEKAAQAEKDKVQEENAIKKIEILSEIEDLILSGSWTVSEDTSKKFVESWDAIGTAANDRDLKKRYRKGLDILSKEANENVLKNIREQSTQNAKQFEMLCLKIENLAGMEPVFQNEEIRRQWMVSELQAKMGKKNAFKNKKDEAQHLIAQCKDLAYVVKETRESLNERIKSALEKVKK